ncbi:MAG: PAS domain S-box protein [Solirubrobacteraceae bacterium]
MTYAFHDELLPGLRDASVRALLERLPGAGVFVTDLDFRVVVCGGGAFAAAGWDPAEIEGSRLPEILDPVRWPALERHYRAALEGHPQGFRLPQDDGGVYQVVAAPLVNGGGVTEGMFVVTVDSTADSYAEERLRETQALLRAAFDATPTALVVFTAAGKHFGRILQANGATGRMFGYSMDSLPGKRIHDVFPPAEADRLDGELRAAAEEGATLSAVEQPLVDARGRQLWGRLHVTFVRDDNGQATLGVAQLEDVSRERLREEALRFSRERFGLIFHQADVGMVMIDLQPGAEGTILELNDAYAELVGRPLDDLPGTSTAGFSHPDEVEREREAMRRMARGEIDRHEVDKRYVLPDGTVRATRLCARAIHDDQGRARYSLGVAIDISDRVRAEAAREGIVESVFEGIVAIDADGLVTVFNRAAEELFGYERSEVMGRKAFDIFVPPEHRAIADGRMAGMWQAPRDSVVAERLRAQLLHADGGRLTVELSMRRTGVAPVEFTAFVRDVSGEHEADRRRRGAEDLFRTMFENSAVGMAVLNLDGRCLEANAELCRFLGRTVGELRASTIQDVTHPEDHVPTPELVEALTVHRALDRAKRFVRPDGQVVWGQVHSTLLIDASGRPRGIQSQVVDINVHRQTDARLGAVLESLAEGVIALDGDNRIEMVNPAAQRLLGFDPPALIGRTMHESIHAHTGRYEDCPIVRVAGTGEAVRVDDDTFARADGSKLPVSYSAAPLGTGDERGVVVVFSDISDRKAREQNLHRRLAALDRLEQTRKALAEDRLVIYTQPILDIARGEIAQEELLLRMRDEDGHIVGPGEFLPVAEEYGLISDIDRWVIGQAATIAARGRHVEVNVSGRTLGHRDLTVWVEEAIERSGADPRLLTFEITETALTADLEQACRFAERIAELGCGFALDDFGTGYGSFTLLKRLPVSYLKIDMEFVRHLVDEEADRHVVQAVVTLARGLGMRTIAEGVEDQATLDLLASMGVDYAQGYLIGRPEPV